MSKRQKKSLAKKLSTEVSKSIKTTVKNKVRKSMSTKNYSKIGADGEQQIYKQLVALFGANCVFRNVYVMKSTGHLTEIDLLAVHSTGVYVVESKNYSGFVHGTGTDTEWVQEKGNKFTRKFYSPVAQNDGHIKALREACQYYVGFVPPMLSLLVFPDRCDLHITGLPMGLRCCRLSQMSSVLRNVVSMVTPVLTIAQINAILSLFYQSQRCMLPKSVQEQHRKDVALARRLAK